MIMMANILGSTEVWLWISILTFVIPIFGLSIVIFIRIVIKQIKTNKKGKTKKIDYLPLFGGIDNILSIKRTETRVSVEVKNFDLVDLEELKNLNIGTMIIGNTVKCSSLAMAEQLEKIKKG